MDELYYQEVSELTELLREEWDDLREILSAKGFDVSTTVLASFCEDDEGMEYGVFVTSEKRIYEYSRNTEQGDSLELTDITDDKAKILEYPQIPFALKMIDE